MHYHAEVWIEDLDDVEGDIEAVMAPHREEYHEATDKMTGFWDWYQIGGRWTGAHTPGYNPADDPRNVETCTLCRGTGFRNDDLGRAERAKTPSYTCNACGARNEDGTWTHGKHGPGLTTKWPTQWATYEGDIIPVSEISEDLTCFTLVIGEVVLNSSEWDGTTFVDQPFKDKKIKQQLAEMGITSGYLVTVDYHC